MNIPETMCAVLTTGHGGIEKLQYVTDYPVPRPGAGEVLIQVRSCGINNTDIWVREGAYGTDANPQAVASWRRSGAETLKFPRIQGADSAGYVVARGQGVASLAVGARVMVEAALYNTNSDSLSDIDYIGHGRDGGYAEYVVVPVDHAHPIKKDLSDAELGTFWCAYHTGEHMLDRARVKTGERVLITGASGGVGTALIQLCRARGAIPFCVCGDGKEEALVGIGAECAVSRSSGDLVKVVKEMMGDFDVDVIADLVAGPMFGHLLEILRPEGRYVTAGAIGGPVVPFDVRTMYLKHLELHGSSQGSRQAFRRLVDYIERGAVKPLLFRTYALSDIKQAQQDFIQKKHIGKLVVVPDSFFEHS